MGLELGLAGGRVPAAVLARSTVREPREDIVLPVWTLGLDMMGETNYRLHPA
jgi:hypothetical protein